MQRFYSSVLLTIILIGNVFANKKAIHLQVVHNAADPAAAFVDVYVNDDKLLDDFDGMNHSLDLYF
jgi:hypothetical protein